MKVRLRVIFINLGIFLSFILIIELFFGAWIFSSNNLNNLGLLRDITIKHQLDGLYKNPTKYVSYSRDKFGFRGKSIFNNPQKIDILTIGGSTTDQRYISEGKTWQDVLEKKLKKNNQKYLVANAGIDGQSTFGHIKNFELWFPEITNLRPKYIMFYIGINDFYSMNSNVFDQFENQDLTFLGKIKKEIKNKSTFYNLYRKISGALTVEKIGYGHDKVNFDKLVYTSKPIAKKELIDFYETNLVGFKIRIKKLIYYSQKMGAQPIFITQPSAKYKIKNGIVQGVADTSFLEEMSYNGVDYFNLLQKLNKVIYIVCENKYHVVELTTLENWEKDDFYDWLHMTPKGEEKVGTEIFKQIKNKIK